jgi:ubiquinone/menaquinone biosynthesis C-methylase UbiE
MEKPQSGSSFKLMSLMFKLRDVIRPRGNILKEVGIKPGFQVLDYGCGPGGYILPLAKLTGATGKIYALDMNPAAILTVKSLAADHKLANVQTILSESATGLPDGSIDIALLYDVLHHLKSPDNVLAEIHRILKPDGILSVSDHHMDEKDITFKISGMGLFRLSKKGKVFNFSWVQ